MTWAMPEKHINFLALQYLGISFKLKLVQLKQIHICNFNILILMNQMTIIILLLT